MLAKDIGRTVSALLPMALLYRVVFVVSVVTFSFTRAALKKRAHAREVRSVRGAKLRTRRRAAPCAVLSRPL